VSVRIKAFPDLVRKEAQAAVFALVGVCLLSAILEAPLAGPADPSGAPEQIVKAPWIFVGIQQMLRYLPPVLAGIALPFAALLIATVVPYLPAGRKTVAAVFFSVIAIGAVLTLWGYLA